MSVASISPQELGKLLSADRDVDLIDVRTPAEFSGVHVQGARLVPLDQLDAARLLLERNGRSAEPLYVICKAGGRGAKACERLAAAGCENVFNVEGGTDACVRAGLPVVRGKACLSLERQVRIAAGVLVLAGVLLGALVHPWLYGLAAFVGCGLVFAGVTDWCGMGMLLARMPWNQGGSAGSCSNR